MIGNKGISMKNVIETCFFSVNWENDNGVKYFFSIKIYLGLYRAIIFCKFANLKKSKNGKIWSKTS